MRKVIDLCADAVPANWLDPLLTGPKAVIGGPPYYVRDIEKLLLAIRDRIGAVEVRPVRQGQECPEDCLYFRLPRFCNLSANHCSRKAVDHYSPERPEAAK